MTPPSKRNGLPNLTIRGREDFAPVSSNTQGFGPQVTAYRAGASPSNILYRHPTKRNTCAFDVPVGGRNAELAGFDVLKRLASIRPARAFSRACPGCSSARMEPASRRALSSSMRAAALSRDSCTMRARTSAFLASILVIMASSCRRL